VRQAIFSDSEDDFQTESPLKRVKAEERPEKKSFSRSSSFSSLFNFQPSYLPSTKQPNAPQDLWGKK